MFGCVKRDTPYPRDGCYAWFVAFCCFCGIGIVFGTINMFSLLLPVWSEEFNFSRGATAWIGSLTVGMMFLLTPLTINLMSCFGGKITGLCACLGAASLLTASSFVKVVYVLYLTHGLLMGFCVSLGMHGFLLISKKWFVKNLGLALGIVIAGSSMWTMFLNPILQLVIDSVGWRNALRIMAAVFVLVALLCLFFTSNVETDDESNARVIQKGCSISCSNIFDCTLWKSPKYTFGMVVIWITFFGYYVALMHIIAFAKDRKVPASKASLLFIFIAGFSTLSRIVMGKINDKKWLTPMQCLQLSAFIIGTSLLSLPQCREFYHFIMFAVYYGIGNGTFITSQNFFLLTCFGDSKRDAHGYAMGQVVKSIPIFVGAPIAGFLADYFQSYVPAFYIVGSIVTLSSFLPFCLLLSRKTQETIEVELELEGEHLTGTSRDQQNETTRTELELDEEHLAGTSCDQQNETTRTELELDEEHLTGTSCDQQNETTRTELELDKEHLTGTSCDQENDTSFIKC